MRAFSDVKGEVWVELDCPDRTTNSSHFEWAHPNELEVPEAPIREIKHGAFFEYFNKMKVSISTNKIGLGHYKSVNPIWVSPDGSMKRHRNDMHIEGWTEDLEYRSQHSVSHRWFSHVANQDIKL